MWSDRANRPKSGNPRFLRSSSEGSFVGKSIFSHALRHVAIVYFGGGNKFWGCRRPSEQKFLSFCTQPYCKIARDSDTRSRWFDPIEQIAQNLGILDFRNRRFFRCSSEGSFVGRSIFSHALRYVAIVYFCGGNKFWECRRVPDQKFLSFCTQPYPKIARDSDTRSRWCDPRWIFCW